MLWIGARTVSVFAACLVGVLWVGGCRGASPRDSRLDALSSAVRQAPSVPSSPIPDEPLRIPVGVDETDRWLWVEKERALAYVRVEENKIIPKLGKTLTKLTAAIGEK